MFFSVWFCQLSMNFALLFFLFFLGVWLVFLFNLLYFVWDIDKYEFRLYLSITYAINEIHLSPWIVLYWSGCCFFDAIPVSIFISTRGLHITANRTKVSVFKIHIIYVLLLMFHLFLFCIVFYRRPSFN